MLLFDVFPPLLPAHNPIGFGAADFLELSLAAAFLLIALRPAFRLLAARPYWCAALLAVLPVLLRMALLSSNPVPVPAGADDFSYLLLSDTLAHGRLANPVHPMHRFFEAVFILQDPSYSSIYPVGQGLLLAFGQLVFGHPWAGVVLSAAAFCSLSYWMLRGWTTAGWALAGGILAVCEFGPLNQWMNLYWGGAVSAAAGCLIFGALPRLARSRRRRHAILLGVGLAIQLLTRPFEFVVLFAPLLAWAAWSARGRVPWKMVTAVLVPVLPALFLTLAQNFALTRSWTTLPYQLSRYQYGVPATFTLQPNPFPHRQLTPEQQLDYEAQSAIHGNRPETVASYFHRLGERPPFLRFFLLAPLYLALPFFLLKLRQPGFLFVLGTLVWLILCTGFYPYFYPHYVAVAASLLLLVAVTSLAQLSKWETGRRAANVLLALCGAHFLFWYGVHLSGRTAVSGDENWSFVNPPDPQGRRSINHELESVPGQHLVFVRYAPRHMFHEWIHNSADIDRARIVWAGDLGQIENEQLRRYYPARMAWLLEPDARPPKLMRYP